MRKIPFHHSNSYGHILRIKEIPKEQHKFSFSCSQNTEFYAESHVCYIIFPQKKLLKNVIQSLFFHPGLFLFVFSARMICEIKWDSK